MTANFWTSSQYEFTKSLTQSQLNFALREENEQSLSRDQIVYIINSIDSLADNLPRFVRSSYCHYSAMVLAQRYIYQTTTQSTVALSLDGETCCHIACLALWVACESDGRLISSHVWDTAVSAVFPCEVVYRGIWSSLDLVRKHFVESIKFNLFVHHPFETIGYLLSELGQSQMVADLALGAINSLYRTTAVIEYPPYVLAVAVVSVAILMVEPKGDMLVKNFLDSTPVDVEAVKTIISQHLMSHITSREIPPQDPPKIDQVNSPSSRASRSVSRHSSRSVTSSSSANSKKTTRSCKRTISTPMSSVPEDVSWALYPSNEKANKSSLARPVTLSELRILREISQSDENANSIVKLVDVELFTLNEEAVYKSSFGQNLIVHGFFDSNGTQFDSVARLMGGQKDRLLTLVEQLVAGVNFLNEHKICHFGLEPKNLMVSEDRLKIASLTTASVMPTIPTTPPTHEYRAPELLLGTSLSFREDDPLAVDLWSLGCVIAELGRIFATRNRYEDPLFVISTESDGLAEKPDAKGPIHDRGIYTDVRYVLKVASVLNGGMLPPAEIWPSINKRQHYEKALALMEYSRKKNPTKFGSNGFVGIRENVLQVYCKEDSSDTIITEIVKALLRWSPEKRVTPRMILQRIGKYRMSNNVGI